MESAMIARTLVAAAAAAIMQTTADVWEKPSLQLLTKNVQYGAVCGVLKVGETRMKGADKLKSPNQDDFLVEWGERPLTLTPPWHF